MRSPFQSVAVRFPEVVLEEKCISGSGDVHLTRTELYEAESGRLRASLRGTIPALVGPPLVQGGFAAQGLVLAPLAALPGIVWGLANVGYTVALYGVLLVGLLWLAMCLDREPYTRYGLDVDRRWIVNAVAGATASALAIGASVWYGTRRGIVTPTVASGAEFLSVNTVVVLVLVAAIGLAVAAYEEVLYRGILLQNFAAGLRARGVSTTGAAIGATAGSLLLFGAFHLLRGPLVAVDATVVGVTFAVAYLLTGELGLAIGVHFGRLPMSVLVQGERFGIDLVSMDVPTAPLAYLEFTLTQIGLTCLAVVAWTALFSDSGLGSGIAKITGAAGDPE